jgi:hypothetical protein
MTSTRLNSLLAATAVAAGFVLAALAAPADTAVTADGSTVSTPADNPSTDGFDALG